MVRQKRSACLAKPLATGSCWRLLASVGGFLATWRLAVLALPTWLNNKSVRPVTDAFWGEVIGLGFVSRAYSGSPSHLRRSR
jgi:hypothetical protein